MRTKSDTTPTERLPSQEGRRAPPLPTRSSDDYLEQSGRAGREVAQRLILEAREELARLKDR